MTLLLAAGLVLLAGSALAQERSIDKEVLINADIERAWRSWTTREGITGFFAPDAEIDARVGGAFRIHMDPRGAPAMKGADDMRVMARGDSGEPDRAFIYFDKARTQVLAI